MLKLGLYIQYSDIGGGGGNSPREGNSPGGGVFSG